MQILKELPNGNRVKVSDWDWQVDKRSPQYVQIVAAGSVIVYGMGNGAVKIDKPLKYGGRSNGVQGHREWTGA